MYNMDKFNDDFIAEAIIQSEYLLEKYEKIIEKIVSNKVIIEKPESDLDPYFILQTENDKIKLKASYIGKILKSEQNNTIFIKWAWSEVDLNKSSKINLIKIFKYFLEREPNENSPIFNQIYNAFIQSLVQVDERFCQVLLNALLHLMKHLFYIYINKGNITEIYLIKEIL